MPGGKELWHAAETGWSTSINFLSALNRQSLLGSLQSNEYDLLVIGGGITGAGIALDAASRGLSVALVEMQDFAAGTSSRSTKLIHGGLRYLKHLEISLVREVGRERAILLRNAPHLVVPETLMLPIIKGGSMGKVAMSLGLLIFDKLVNVAPEERRKILSKSEALSREPILNKELLEAAGCYTEYRTDDARLTIEVMKAAAGYGAHCASYVMCDRFIYENKRIKHVVCKDLLGETELKISAKQVVNATGPWVDKVRKLEGKLDGKRLVLTKGIHIVIPREKLPINNSIYFDAPDGRMLFAIPRFDKTYLGTTDTYYQDENLKNPQATLDDVNYLLDGTNRIFPSAAIKKADIISSWAGLRPLIYTSGKSPSELSRQDELLLSESGLISIAGGKLTGYRKMAERTVNLVCERIHPSKNSKSRTCITENITLSGGDYSSPEQLKAHISNLEKHLSSLDINPANAERMVRSFGTQSEEIIKRLSFDNNEDREIALIKAELNYCITDEACFNLNDFYLRRTGRIHFYPETVSASLAATAGEMKRLFALSDIETENQIKEVEKSLINITTFM